MLNSFKNAILQKLTNFFNNEQLEMLFSAIDEISNQFSIIPSKDNNKKTQISNNEYLEKFGIRS